MLLHYGLVKVLRVEVYVQGTIRFMGYVRDDTNLVVWETGAMTPLSTMSLRACSICSQYSMGTFHWACWTGAMEGSLLMVYIQDILSMVSKEPGQACFKVMMS